MADTYSVLSQVPDMELNPTGNGFINGWKITYKVTSGPATGTTGTVFVTDDQHNAATVGSMITAKLKDLGDIASLGNS